MIPRPQHSTLFPYTTLFRSSYGSMSYAGLKSFIYANLKKDDPRVVAAVNWLKRNYSVDENPALGAQGLYRSEEHTSELQSHHDLVCRLLLEKKNDNLMMFHA